MKPLSLLTVLLACCAPALAQQVVSPEPLGEPATTVYRQVTPDGRVVYSDKPLPGAKVEETLDVDVSQDGGTWSVEGSTRPPAARVAKPTPVKQVASIPANGRKTIEDANAEVIRSEMLLEDARRRREAGHALLPAEKDGTGPGSAYVKRQQDLAQAVKQAEAALRQAKAEQDALRRTR